ncbi:transposase IS116/IS110/IS902 family protein [Caballeronia turbans]|nr:transposase IS116/IS110/IS902 family protein [Caballeronia turbans]
MQLKQMGYQIAHTVQRNSLFQHHAIGGLPILQMLRDERDWISAQLRLAAVAVGRTNTALGAFYRRLATRIGKAKAVTATARKIAVLFYNTMRFGMQYKDPGADHYESQYRERVIKQLHRRAAEFGYILHEATPKGVS